jgi:hypothetical protein
MANPKVLDFLYHDARRVGSILAQLDEAGLLTSVVSNDAKTSANKIAIEGQLEGSIPFVSKASGGTSLSRDSSRTGQLERTFDPLWRNARRFVEYAETASVEISDSNIGQIVTVTGQITIVDFDFLKNFFANKAIMESLFSGTQQGGNRQERRVNRNKPNTGKANDPPFAELFGLFPYKIQMTVEGQVETWSTVVEEFLVTQASDLVLKYGGALDGRWTMIGVLDAMPSYFDGNLVGDLDFSEVFDAFGMKLTKAMAPMARVFLGRPFNAYGVTPLVVFRQIK